MLVVNSHYSNKERTVPHKREIIEIKISDNFQRAFSNKSHSIILREGNLKAVVTCIELARALFLHNVHLTRTALRPNGLHGMAVVDDAGEECIIRFNRSSDYPLKNLNSKDACKHLSWLLLNPEATKSFNSVYSKLQQDESTEWNFNFEPPPLKKWRLEIAGEYDRDDPMLFYVEEIITVYPSSFKCDKKVSIYHPKKVDVIPVGPSDGKRPEINRTDPDPQLDFQATPGNYRKRDVVSEKGFRFICDLEDDVKVMPGKALSRVVPNVNATEEPKPDVSAVGHGTATGSAQELDWAINRSDCDDTTLPEAPKEVAPTGNFQLFEKVIQKLMMLPDYQFQWTRCLAMPKPDNASLIYKNKLTQEARTFHCAYFYYRQTPLVIIEVDISDINDKHSLGSRLFGFSENGKDGLAQVMKACSEKGVRWDAKANQEHCSVVVEIKHPSRTKKVEGESVLRTEIEYETAWIETIDKAVKRAVTQEPRKVSV